MLKRNLSFLKEAKKRNYMGQSVAKFKLNVREKAHQDAAAIRVGELVTDPTVSEEVKDVASFLMVGSVISQLVQSPEGRAVNNKWKAVQIPLMEAMRFPGSTVEVYDSATDGISGAYLQFVIGSYTVTIDAEDAESMEEIKKRGYLSVEIFKDRPPVETIDELNLEDYEKDVRMEGLFIDMIVDGCIPNIETGQAICQALKDDDEDRAVGLVKTYQQLVDAGLIIESDE